MNWGTLAGALLGGGAYLSLQFWNARRPSLTKRVEPYLRAGKNSEPNTGRASGRQFAAIVHLIAPWLRTLIEKFQTPAATNRALRDRLQRAGADLTPTEFRAQQVLWAAAALAFALAVTLPLVITGRTNISVALLLLIIFPASAALARDWMLNQAITRRETALARQLPTIAELLALAVGAGETPLAALERVTKRTCGEFSLELQLTLSDIHAGTPMDIALQKLAKRSQVAAITRFADAIAVAIERGTPLAQVLHDQARDARDNTRRELLELSGRKEIAMLVPVIFFILPITVMFAIFPGLAALQGGL